jgi:hypothetical protein
MSEPLDRVNKAIAKAIESGRDPGLAALVALREPTPEMTKAAWSRYEQGHIKTAWRLMIAAALRDKIKELRWRASPEQKSDNAASKTD